MTEMQRCSTGNFTLHAYIKSILSGDTVRQALPSPMFRHGSAIDPQQV
ncbi:MAG TPA: hypothetical protein K8V47_03165 [Candidatus Amulumruptor caecigallinarius]|uniref:Uncharacterized protein n=1 Tax=Candidatus Amulumruptor caecigallinarius TaxID=2109911 RepID=A0A921E7F8_9BACT|nr:hypothetical protein [Candidatus Amulumruptor caecigallinarius]